MFVSFVLKGGIVMVPIILLSVAMLAIVLERAAALWRARGRAEALGVEVLALVRKGQHLRAAQRCAGADGNPTARLLALGLAQRARGREELESLLEREGDRAMTGLEKGLGALLVIVGVEPMLGFLGTIVGLIQAFMSWERLGSAVTVNVLAGGIYQAMITTAAGLCVAIPGYILYHWILAQVRRHAREMSYWGTELIEGLKNVRRPAAIPPAQAAARPTAARGRPAEAAR